jgi:hypothetical protein
MTQAKAKSNSVVTTQWTGDILSINVIGVGELMFDRTKASQANRDQAERHGWTQRHMDKAAKPAPTRKPGMTDGQWAAAKAAVVQEKFNAIKQSIDHYEAGEVAWKMSGGGSGESGLLLTALCRLRPGLTVAQVAGFLESRSPEQLRAIKVRRDVIEMQNQVRLERAGEDNDAESAFDELDAIDTEEDDKDDSTDEEIARLMAGK